MKFDKLLKRIPKTVVLIDAAIVALSATLIRNELIPENVSIIGPIGSLLVVVGVVMTFAYQPGLQRSLKLLTWLATGMLVLLLLLHVAYVEPVSPYGGDGGTHQFLVGHGLTPQGQEWASMAGAQSRAEIIKAVGDNRIRAAWGFSYTVIAVGYAIAYMGFLLCSVLALGGTDLARAEDSS